MCAGGQKMSSVQELKEKIQKELDDINVESLSEQSKMISFLHDRIVPILNEIMTSSAAEAKDYEDGYKLVVTRIRKVLEGIVAEKRNADVTLMTLVGKKAALEGVVKDLTTIVGEQKVQTRKERIDTIAEKIESGSFDPDAPRKIGERPEKIKDIRAAKATLFGGSRSDSNPKE